MRSKVTRHNTLFHEVFFFNVFCFYSPAENVFNLREENKHLRKAHHDIHVQLQDVQVRNLGFIENFQ